MVARAGIGSRRYVVPIAAAVVVAAIGSAMRCLEILGVVPARVHDVTYAVAGLIAAAATFAHPDLGPTRRRTRIVVDTTIAALSTSTVLWLVAGRSLFGHTGDRVDALASVVAVAFALAVLRATLVLTNGRPRGSHRAEAAALAAVSFAALAVGGVLHLLAHAYRDTTASAVSTLTGDAALVVGFAMLSAVGVALRQGLAVTRFELSRATVARGLQRTPILAVGAAVLAVLIDAGMSGRFDPTASAILTFTISAVLVRQSLTLSDNRALSSSLRTTVDELEQQATHDALTGLPNRYGLEERIIAATRRGGAASRTCAVMFIDLDHLKSVNDSLGHRAGDMLIIATAERLVARVGPTVTRFGGDEFVVVVDTLGSARDAEELARRIVEDACVPIEVDGHQIRPSCSIGLATVTGDEQPEELLRRADVALYQAKSRGRQCVAVYSRSEDHALEAGLDLEPELRRAVDNGEFILHYQPIVELRSGRVVGAESLLRWEHPRRGLLGPAEFLDQCIAAGLLGAIGAASLRRVCAETAPTTLGSVSVNLSSSELADRRVVHRVASAIHDAGLAPTRLTLEITEDVIIDDTVRATIDTLCALGVHLAIDDFGTGNSSLRQLGAYPAGVLKIDRSFVEQLQLDERARAITAAIVRLAHSFGLVTVAEGVETREQAELLTDMGCDRAQGWLFARAMPLDELEAWCAAYTPAGRSPQSRPSTESASSMIRASSSDTGGRSVIAPTT